MNSKNCLYSEFLEFPIVSLAHTVKHSKIIKMNAAALSMLKKIPSPDHLVSFLLVRNRVSYLNKK